MFDIYDGAMWTGIMDADDDRRSFVEHPRSLLLTLNIDWFRHFKNSHCSCGAIYLGVNNLPRTEQFKKENVILVGVMPGPKEAKSYEMNHYLQPLVSELEKLYFGVRMSTHEHPNDEVIVRAALLMVACGIPAARKVSGFTSHNSTRACYKCVRNFTRSETANRLDYSGFDVTTWIPATWQQNVEDAQRWLAAQNWSERQQLERETGVRWSQLHRLSYFDTIRCTVVDPMHNLFLGTAKRMMDMWIKEGIVTSRHLKEMKSLATTLLIPSEYDVIKSDKIVNKFSGMKAAEWKSWCLVYSPYLLYNVLSTEQFSNWMNFVNACRYLSKPSIRVQELDEAHSLLISFCQECERIYSTDLITANMHLHGHLKQTLLDFGPPTHFGCLALRDTTVSCTAKICSCYYDGMLMECDMLSNYM